MKAQHVGSSIASSASSSVAEVPTTSPARLLRRGLACATVALLCAATLGASQLPSQADARTAKASPAPAPASLTVGVGLQRSTHEALGPSYATAKLGDATGTPLHSESSARTVVTVVPAWEPEPASYASDGAQQQPASDAWEPVSSEEPSYDAAPDASWDEPAYEEPSYEEPTPSEPSYDYDEPSYEEAPAYDWYTVQASAYSVATNGGTTTASGVPLDDWSLTVASPWVPLGSVVEIEYAGMTVQATVTDRGPYVGGRDLDLTPGVIAAFGFSDIYDWGVRTVTYRVL